MCVCVYVCVCEAWGVIVWQSLRALVCVRLRLCIRFVSGLWFARVTCRLWRLSGVIGFIGRSVIVGRGKRRRI